MCYYYYYSSYPIPSFPIPLLTFIYPSLLIHPHRTLSYSLSYFYF